MEPKQILLGIFIVIILVVLYNWLFSDKTIKNVITLKDASTKEIINAKDIEHTANFSYSLWLFVNDYNYNYGKDKHIIVLTEETDKSKRHYQLYLDSFKGDLTFEIFSPASAAAAGAAAPEKESTKCVVENIPLQKWTHVLVSYRNRAIDLYIDGKLTKTCTLEKDYDLPSKELDVLVCPGEGADLGGTATGLPGFRGFLGSMRYFTRAVQPREAYAIYKEGYSSGNWLSDLFNKYKLKFAFLEDDKEINSLVL